MKENGFFEKVHRRWTRIIWKFRGLKVFALVGPSGTGKSFRARLVAEKLRLDAIIDDGLLIAGEKIVAGKSAKKEVAYLAAVKTALFSEPEHRRQVKTYIEKSSFKKILIIGTSERMVQKICATLQLPKPFRVIKIEEIASADEITTAIHFRKNHGRHVIPVPVIEVKQNYPRLIADSFKVLWSSGFGIFRKKRVYEKSLVRPEFSKKGEITISEAALSQMIMHCVAEKAPGFVIHKLVVRREDLGYELGLFLDVKHGVEIAGTVHDLHTYIIERIESYTGIIIEKLDIQINKILRI